MKFILSFLLLGYSLQSYSSNDFVLKGSTNHIVNGKVILRKVVRGDFYRSQVASDTAIVTNHHFQFSGTIIYPELFRLFIFDSEKSLITEVFFLDSGLQAIVVDSQTKIKSSFDVGFGVKLTGSNADREYSNEYLSLFTMSNMQLEARFSALNDCDLIADTLLRTQCENKIRKEIKVTRGSRNNIILGYSLAHKSSPIVPWMLSEAARRYGFQNVFAKIYDSTSIYYADNLRQELHKTLSILRSRTVGETFPLFEYILSEVKFPEENNFILIEFWFSACMPCLAQFEELRSIYKRYCNNGFEIVAISIDDNNSIKRYSKLLLEKKYPWRNLLDKGGTKTLSMNIERFPANVLLNSTGQIILVDVTPVILNAFLKDSNER